jgi:predicted dehydrogenase
MDKKVRVGVVGAGWPSWQHIKGYKKLEEVELSALCDKNPEQLSKIADEYEIPNRYTSFEEMLEKEKMDAVSICTPNILHGPMAVSAMEAGLHVHVEKPMCVNSDVGRKMVETSKRTGKLCMIGYQRRFGEEAHYLKRFIEEGRMGEVYLARAWWVRRKGIPGMGGWFTTKAQSGGGALIDIGVHVLDLALWFMGYPKPEHVSGSYGSRFGVKGKGGSNFAWRAENTSKNFDVDDYAVGHVDFGGGRSLMLQTSWASHIKTDEVGIELWGEEAGARLFPLEIFTDDGPAAQNIAPVFGKLYAFDASTRHFIDCIKGRAECISPPEEGLRTIEIIEQIYNSGNGRK